MRGGGQWRGTIARLCRRDSDAFPHVAARQTSLCGRSDTLLETVSRGAKRCPRGQICKLTPLKAAVPTRAESARIPPVNFETDARRPDSARQFRNGADTRFASIGEPYLPRQMF